MAISGIYVDDITQAAGNDENKQIIKFVREIFDIKITDYQVLKYVSLLIYQLDPVLRRLSQQKYISRLSVLNLSFLFNDFR